MRVLVTLHILPRANFVCCKEPIVHLHTPSTDGVKEWITTLIMVRSYRYTSPAQKCTCTYTYMLILLVWGEGCCEEGMQGE